MLRIVPFPHPALRYESRPVTRIDEEFRSRIREMFDLLYEARGIGLAANQVGIPFQFFILNISADPAKKELERVFVNPTIVKRHASIEGEEGCLSFPGLYSPVNRARKIKVQAFDIAGNPFELDAEDLESRAIQHETDHVHGRLFIDYFDEKALAAAKPKIREIEQSFRRAQGAKEFPSDDEILRELERIAAEG